MSEIKIGNLSNLNMIEIIALKVLLEYPKPIKRYTLYVIVNDFLRSEIATSASIPRATDLVKKLLKSSEKRKKVMLSSSSFYNSLLNLEKRGLISFNLKTNGKIYPR